MKKNGSINVDIFKGVKIEFASEFINFAIERQAILERRQSGMPAPWTNDPTLKKYHFSNIFRDDDRVTKFIYDWVKSTVVHLPALFGNLAYARMCNKPSTLQATGLLAKEDGSWQNSDELLELFAKLGGKKRAHGANQYPLWVNAYQVPGNFKQILGISSREELIARHIPNRL